MCHRLNYGQRLWRLVMAVCLSITLITSSLVHGIAFAQTESDFEIPVLTIEKSPTGNQEEDQQFIVRVTDNNAVGSVKLFYRFSANDNFTEATVKQLENDSELYTATISQQEISSNIIQYYLSAADLAGNVVQRGYSFAPLTLNLLKDNVAASDSNATGVKTSSNRTLYTVLGVLAAGALIGLAASAGGGSDSSGAGDGGGGTGCGSSGCVLTITAPRP